MKSGVEMFALTAACLLIGFTGAVDSKYFKIKILCTFHLKISLLLYLFLGKIESTKFP